MIHLAIKLLSTQLNQHLRRTYNLGEDAVVVSNLLEMDGTAAANINNKLIVFLVNIEKDPVPFRKVSLHEAGEREMQNSAPLYFNIYLMMTANFTGINYPEALKFLSSTIGFFQKNHVFNRQTTPEMDNRIEKLILDIENLSIQDLSNFMGRFRLQILAIDPLSCAHGSVRCRRHHQPHPGYRRTQTDGQITRPDSMD